MKPRSTRLGSPKELPGIQAPIGAPDPRDANPCREGGDAARPLPGSAAYVLDAVELRDGVHVADHRLQLRHAGGGELVLGLHDLVVGGC